MSSAAHTPMEEMEVFRRFVQVGDWVWNTVGRWKPFQRDTIGRQLVRAADSIGANLVEGDGRYGHADALHFFIIARASARETRYWLLRTKERGLIDAADCDSQIRLLESATQLLNRLITYRRSARAAGAPTPKSVKTRTPERLTVEVQA